MLEMRDAKIVVRLDVRETESKLESVERRVERTRRAQEDAEEGSSSGGASGRSAKIALRELAHGQLYGAARSMLQSVVDLPLETVAGGPISEAMNAVIKIGKIAAITAIAGMTAAELNERFGPLLAPIVRDQLKQFLPGALVEAMPQVSGEAASKWASVKAHLAGVGAALDATSGVVAAKFLSGGTVTPQEIVEEYGLQYDMAVFLMELMKSKRRMEQSLTGEGLAGSLEKVLDGMTLDGSVGK